MNARGSFASTGGGRSSFAAGGAAAANNKSSFTETQVSVAGRRNSGASVTAKPGAAAVRTRPAGQVRPLHAQPFNACKKERTFIYDFAASKGHVQKKIDALDNAPKKELNSVRMAVVKKAFQKVDKDGSGVLDIEDIRQSYNAKMHPKVIAGEWTEDEVLRKFLNKFETDAASRDGRVTWDEFKQYYEKLGATVKDDNYFVLMVAQAWKL